MHFSLTRTRASRALLSVLSALVLAVALAPAAGAGQKNKSVEWGVYAQLVGTTWTAPGGWPRKAWRWSPDGSSIIELEQRDARSAPTQTTIEPAKNGDKLVAHGPAGKRKGTIGNDGAVAWTAEGKGEDGSRVVLRNGQLVEQVVERSKKKGNRVVGESVSTPSNDKAWVDAALAGTGTGKDKRNKQVPTERTTTPSNVVIPPPSTVPAVANAPAPAAGGNDSLDCMMQSAAVRAAGCKPPSASSAPATAPAGAAAAGVQVLSVDGQRMPVSRSFPPQITGRYLYEKHGEPIIELRQDGTGLFQAHMIAPIAIRWWLKAGANGVPEKITAANGNYRYTVVLQYQNSNNLNYPSGSYASWYLDTDVAGGCSIILGERFKCR